MRQSKPGLKTTEKRVSVFKNGRSQAVRIPAEWRFPEGRQVYMRRDARTGELIISDKPGTWDDFIAFARTVEVPDNFPAGRQGTATMGRRKLF